MTKTKSLTITHSKRKAMSDPEIRSNLKGLITAIDKGWVQICTLLHKVYNNELFKIWGYPAFEDYTLKELGMQYRVAMIHQQIGETIDLHNLDDVKIGEIGWSKFKCLTYLINEDTKEEEMEKLFADARSMSLEKLKDHVFRLRAEKLGKRVSKRQNIKFSLIQDQVDVWEATRKEIFLMSGIEDPGRQFEFLCINFGLHHNPVDTEEVIGRLSPEEEVIKLERKQRADKNITPPKVQTLEKV